MQLIEKILFGLFNTLIAIIGPVGNVCILYAILSKKKHREVVSNTYLVTLAITDLLGSIIIAPYYLLSLNLPEYNASLAEKYSEPCKAANFFVYAIGINRILALTLMSVDRYFAILHPFLYQRFINRRRAVAMNLFIIVQSCVTNLPMSLIPGWVNYDGKPGAPCGFLWDGKLLYLIPYAILNFAIPLIVLVFSNTKVFVIARKQRRQILSMQRKRSYVKKGGAFGMSSSVTHFPAMAMEPPADSKSGIPQRNYYLAYNNSRKSQHTPQIKPKFVSKCPDEVPVVLVRENSSSPDGKRQNNENCHNLVEQGDILKDNVQTAREIETSKMGDASGIKQMTFIPLKQNSSSCRAENVHTGCCTNDNIICSSTAPHIQYLKEAEESKNDNCGHLCANSDENGEQTLRNFQDNANDKTVIGKTQMPMIQTQDVIITFSTIVIVVLFLISWLPFALSRIAFVIDRRLFSWHTVVWTAALTIVSSVGNPLIVLGTRRDLRKTIKKRCKIGEWSLAS